MAVSYATYERLALEDSDTQWELVRGKLRERPPMSQATTRSRTASWRNCCRNWTPRASNFE